MSYLPELRASLIRAAQRQAAADDPARANRRPHRPRPRLGAVATVLVCVATVAVAALAIAVIGHGGHSPRTAAPGATTNGIAARAAAERVLGQVVLPAGAVALRSDPTGQLGSLPDRLATADVVDVRRFWRVPGGPGSVMRFLRAHRPPGSRATLGGEAGSGQTPRAGSHQRGTFHITQATQVFSYPVAPDAVILREAAVEAFAVAGGASVVRVDGESGWLLQRPAGEQIPAGVRLVRVTTRKTFARRGPVQRTSSITAPARILALVTLIDTLPRAQQTTGPCMNRSHVSIRFAFYATRATTPLAVSDNDLTCGVLRLSIGARPWPDLAFGVPGGDPRRTIASIRALVSFAPRP